MFELFSRYTYVLAAKAQTRQNGGAGSVLYSLGVLHNAMKTFLFAYAHVYL